MAKRASNRLKSIVTEGNHTGTGQAEVEVESNQLSIKPHGPATVPASKKVRGNRTTKKAPQELPDDADGPRQAKVAALSNAVWLKAHGSRAGSSKRPAPAVSPGTESQKIKRAKRGGTLILSTSSISHGHDTPYRLTSHDVVEFNVQLHATKHPLTALPPSRPYSSSATDKTPQPSKGQVTGGLNVPSAPRKPTRKAGKKNQRSGLATPSVSPPDNEAVELPKPRPLPKTKKSDVAPENEAVNPPLAPKMKGKDQAIDKDEDQASNDGSSCTEEDTDHELSEYEHHPSEDEDLQEFKKKPTRLIKALTNERPAWPQGGNTEAGNSGKRKANIMIRSCPVEISETDSCDESSPTQHIQANRERNNKKETEMLNEQADQPEGSGDDSSDASVIEIDSESTDDEMVVEWPKFTNIAYSARGRILLNQQRFELKLILRQAIAIIEGKLIFEHSFPDLATRAIWKRKALLKAITHIMNMPTTVAQGSYGTFKSRVREDADYVNDLSKVIETRISLLRKNFKNAASMSAMLEFELRRNCGDRVKELIEDMRYIYPTGPNGNPMTGRPYENPAIISVIKRELFCSMHLMGRYPQTAEKDKEATPSLLAFAATAVRAALDEWLSGERRSTDFSANLYSDVYQDHVEFLKHTVEARNPKGYKTTLRRVFHSASADVASVLNGSTLFDADAMDDEMPADGAAQ